MGDEEIHRADDIGRGRGDRIRGDRGISAKEIAVLAVVMVFVVLAALNFDDAHVDLIFDTVTLPLIVVMIGCSVLGFAIGYFVSHRRTKRGLRD